MPRNEKGGPGETANPNLYQGEAEASVLDRSFDLGLFWNDVFRFCASCGGPYMDIEDGRCGTCIGDDLRHCPACGFDLAAMVNREIARRFRQASNDVSEIWSERRMTSRFWEWQQVLAARKKARVA